MTPPKTERLRGLMAVTPDTDDTARLVAQVRAALEGGAALVQYRNKSLDADLRLEQATALRALCYAAGRPLIVNDDLALALVVAADGVHLGREDGDLQVARAALGPDKILGVSCYNEAPRAQAAVAAGADYIAFGAVFASATKPQAVTAPLSLLTHARSLGRPVVAIGGITREHATAVIAAGAHMLAVISDLFNAPDIRAQSAAYAQLF